MGKKHSRVGKTMKRRIIETAASFIFAILIVILGTSVYIAMRTTYVAQTFNGYLYTIITIGGTLGMITMGVTWAISVDKIVNYIEEKSWKKKHSTDLRDNTLSQTK